MSKYANGPNPTRPATAQANTLRAIVQDKYGSPYDVLELQDIVKPVVKDDEVLVRVHAASVNPYDGHFMTGVPYFVRMRAVLLKPKVNGLGADLAGQAEPVGKNVTQFRPGDKVFGEVNAEVPSQPFLELVSCAEYVSVSQNLVVLKPANLTFDQAAAVPHLVAANSDTNEGK